MSRIHILGGTGFAGRHLVHEAAGRGHEVVSISRRTPADAVPGVLYRAGDVLQPDVLDAAFRDTDVVLSALSTVGSLSDGETFKALIGRCAQLAAERGIRLGIIGGAGSLRLPDGSLLLDAPDFPDVARPAAVVLTELLDDLRAIDDERLDWFFVSPAAFFGVQDPGHALGHYRVGTDTVLFDDNGVSAISGEDLALAVIDEVESPAHHRQRFTVAY